MRLIMMATAMLAVLASPARSACIPYESRSPEWWAAGMARRADIVMVAEVVKAQDAPNGKPAEIRPITVYKGQPSSIVLMSLPPSEFVTEFYTGFGYKIGDRPFLVLYASPSGFKTSPCDYVVERSAVRQALIAALGLTPATPNYQQPDDQFRAALENGSTSPSFILITIQDGRDRSMTTGCTLAPSLLGAKKKENALPDNEEGRNAAIRIAANARGHFFTFHRPEALANSIFNDTPRVHQACAIVRSGDQAYMSDRSGEVRTGLPNPH